MSTTTVVHNTVTAVFTGTVGQAISTALSIPPPAKTAASASILDKPHKSPTIYNSGDPIVLFCIQAGLIIVLARFLGYFLGKLRQPKVIAEVIAGILLGPSVFGRIPGFTQNIFPPASLPNLSLVANLGLCLFLFLVGVETDFSVFKRNARSSLSISAVGMILPFGLGAAVAVGLYNKFVDDDVDFSHFLLFVSVAFSITAFPVLARILTELQLLQTDVGVSVLAAGVGNDIVGWILLALTIALVNAGSGVVAVYVLLCVLGWILLLVFVVRPIFIYYCRRTGSFETGPTNSVIVVIILLILASSFFTDIIGVHAMFGGFIAGVIMPHHKGFTASLIEKLEDLVTVLFLPLYFTFSGLRTDLGLLNNGSIWGWAICVISVSFVSKFSGCFLTARLNHFTWRESAAVGSLMSCKGLVELIVLNVGLSAGILNNAIFAMFVLMALVTTFATTPLTLWFYPVSYRQKLSAERSGKGGVETAVKDGPGGPSNDPGEDHIRSSFAFVLSRMEQLPLAMSFTKLLQIPVEYPSPSAETESKFVVTHSSPTAKIDVIRLMELTERASAVQKAADFEETLQTDPLANIYSTFAALNAFEVQPQLAVLNPDQFPDAVAEFVEEKGSDMVIVPWAAAASATYDDGPSSNALESLFRGPSYEKSPQYASFVRKLFQSTACDVGLFMDQGVFGKPSALPGGRQHVFMAFHGGPDDRAALDVVLQLCRHPGVTATVVRIVKSESDGLSSKDSNITAVDEVLAKFTVAGPISGGDTIYPSDPAMLAQSQSADNILIAQYFEGSTEALPKTTQQALQRVTFVTEATATPLRTSLAHLDRANQGHDTPLLVVCGRSRRQAPSHRVELAELLREASEQGLGIAQSSEVRKVLGDLGSMVVVKGRGSLLVVQSKM